jgi:hypothetical protein
VLDTGLRSLETRVMKALAVLLLVLGCAACSDDDNDVTGPTTAAVQISGRAIEFFSRQIARSAQIEFRTTAGSPVTATTTDAAGQYSATLPRGGEYRIFVNGNAHGTTYVGGSGYRGDLMIHSGSCVARYGTVTDVTGRPLARANVSLGFLSAVSAVDGWYSIEFGCPTTGAIGGNTVLMNVTLDGYTSSTRVLDHVITGVQRFDVALNSR